MGRKETPEEGGWVMIELLYKAATESSHFERFFFLHSLLMRTKVLNGSLQLTMFEEGRGCLQRTMFEIYIYIRRVYIYIYI